MLDKLHDYHFEYFVKFFDYKTWLSGCYKELAGISGCHFFHFTQKGVRAYTDALDNPLSDMPLEIITHRPASDCPPYYNAPPIPAKRLKKFEMAKKPPGTNLFWENILKGGLGTNQANFLNPNFIDHVCYASKNEKNENEEDGGKEVEPEETVVKFGKLIADEQKDCYLLETQFSGSKEFILNERSCFIDEGADGEEAVINEELKKWENQHPVLKRKFMSKPSQYSSIEKKQRLSKDTTGAVLSSGRSQSG